MDTTPRGYRFGDVTKGLIKHWNVHSGAVKNRIDWIKAGKALVDYLVAHGTISIGIVGLTVFNALRDPKDVQEIGAAVAAAAGVMNLIRRIMAGTAPAPALPKEPTSGEKDRDQKARDKEGNPGGEGDPRPEAKA